MSFIKEHKEIIGLSFFTILFTVVMIYCPMLTGHDSNFHLANIENLKQQISFTNLFPIDKIVPNLSHNMGYGLYLFYPMMPHLLVAYLSKILGFLSIDTYTSLSIFYVMISIVSVYFIYQLSYKMFQKKHLAILSAICFLCMPYRIGAMTVRCALNEFMAFLFIPMILLSLLYLKDRDWKRFYLYFVIGYIGLIWSHLAMALYTTLFFIPLILMYREDLKDKLFLKHVGCAILIVAIMVLPGILTTFSQKGYLVFKNGYMTSIGLLKDNTLGISEYLSMRDNYDWTVPYFIPIGILFLLLYSFIIYLRKKEKNLFITILWCLFFGLVFTMSSYFPWKHVIESLWMIQFPWRLLSILSIVISLLIPIGLEQTKEYIIWIIITILLLSMLPFVRLLWNRPYKLDKIDLEYGKGNISEYYPEEYLEYPSFYESNNDIDIVKGNAKVYILENEASKMEFMVKTDVPTTLELPKIYYNGYVVTKEDGSKIIPSRSKHGLISVTIKENGTYQLAYKDVWIVRISKMIRLITIGMILWNYTRKRIKNKI